MLKYLIAVLLLIAGALVWMQLGIGVPRVYPQFSPPLPQPHLYDQPEMSITTIQIVAIYFVPKNKTANLFAEWRPVLESHLHKLQAFHALQFQGRSTILFDVYPKVIVGREDNRTYDTDVTQHGNPEALKSISQELEARVFEPGGDHYRPGGISQPVSHYRVLLIIYEGVGAAGSDNVALFSRTFLSDPRYGSVGASIVAHEFYHTLGLPDAYELESARPTSLDLMGLGRLKPIEQAYLSHEVLKHLGF